MEQNELLKTYQEGVEDERKRIVEVLRIMAHEQRARGYETINKNNNENL